MDSASRALFEHSTQFGEIEPGVRSRTFGRIAVEKGFLSQAELDAAVAEQQALAAKGQNELLGLVLIRTRRLSLPQIIECLKEQNKHVLVCTCGRQYLVEQRGPAEYRCGACGTILAPPEPTLFATQRIGPYELLGELGRGGIGVVFCARDPRTGSLVALKTHKFGKQATAASLARFRTEAENAARLDHPAIVRVLDRGEHDGVPWFAMELLGGETLDHVLPGLPLRGRVELLEKVARGVAHAHAAGVVHGDLAPSNVIVTPAGPKVLDFGLSKNKEWPIQVANAGGFPIGTLRFMSPEEVLGTWDAVDERSDTWALGVMLFQALADRLPFEGDRLADVAVRILQEEPVWPGGPAPLVAICRQAIDKEKSIRYATASLVAEDLRRWLEGSPVQARPPSPALRFRRSLWRHRRALLNAALLLALLALVIGYAVHEFRANAAALHARERARADQLSREAAAVKHRESALEGIAKARSALQSVTRGELERRAAEAATLLKAALGRGVEVRDVSAALGDLSRALGEDRDAEACYRAAGSRMLDQLHLDLALLRGTATAESLVAAPAERRAAYDLFLREQWEAALAPLGLLIEKRPIDGIARLMRALANEGLGRLQDALSDAKAALLLRPRDPIAWGTSGRLHGRLDRYEEALLQLTRSLQFEDRATARADRARTLLGLNRVKEALGDIDDAVRREPNADRCALRGRLLMKVSRWRDARESLERARTLDPSQQLDGLIEECRGKEGR